MPPQTLYKFGVDPADPTSKAITPTLISTSDKIKILWSSWCDLIYTTTNHDSTSSITYLGTSLNATQQLDFPVDPWDLGSSNMRASLLNPEEPLCFFGTVVHDGVRGYIANGKITVFGTPAEEAEMGDAYRDIDSWKIPHTLYHSFAEVSMCSDNSLLLCCRPKQPPGDRTQREVHRAKPRSQTISYVANLQKLQEQCTTEVTMECLAQFAPTQLVVNATTATALDQDGRVHTNTTDPRYPSCLGRPYTGTSRFEPVPYLSETRIVKIASGGYMTGAISEDGELFLWGQANPGVKRELGVLHRLNYDLDHTEANSTVIRGNTMQDDDIKCLDVFIAGEAASVYDVAIGFGHILVAAKSDAGQLAVFAAGSGDEGQLGLGKTCVFLEEFEEIVAMRGRRITQMAATGWSSFVVVNE